MRDNLFDHPKVSLIAGALAMSDAETIAYLYRLASWLQLHGKYGKVKAEPYIIDMVIKVNGFAKAVAEVGWLKSHDGVLTAHGFCTVSATRKSLGSKVRRSVLSVGKCAACSSTIDLVIDHKTPIVRGGSCEIENLQALCAPCNRRKGRKTMEEFIA